MDKKYRRFLGRDVIVTLVHGEPIRARLDSYLCTEAGKIVGIFMFDSKLVKFDDVKSIVIDKNPPIRSA